MSNDSYSKDGKWRYLHCPKCGGEFCIRATDPAPVVCNACDDQPITVVTDPVRRSGRGVRIIEGTNRVEREGWGFLGTKSVTPENAKTNG